MKLALIFFPYKEAVLGYEEQRLMEEAQKRGMELNFWFDEDLEWQKEGLFHKGTQVTVPDRVLVRVQLLGEVAEQIQILERFQAEGVTVINPPDAIAVAKNKIRSLEVLKKAEIPHPKTAVIQAGQEAILKEWTYPLIIKEPYGSYGHGVLLAETERSARSMVDALFEPWGKQKQLMLQEFIREAGGADHRLLVAGGRVVAAMKRQAQGQEFRSNAELGAVCTAYTPSTQEVERALQATQALGLQVAGVDLLDSSAGPLVLELNANPGFKALEQATGLNVADLLLQSL